MLFNSIDFILFTLFAVAAFWLASRSKRARNLVLLLTSWAFYMAYNPWYIGLIVASTCWDYAIGLSLGQAQAPKVRKALVVTSVVGNLGMLGIFKYFNFFVRATGDTLRWVHQTLEATVGSAPSWLLTATESWPILDVLLPVGISFYTFQTMSYTIDVYRRKMPHTANFIDFAAYVAFFPQLVAGPIVRAQQFLPQLVRPPLVNPEMVGRGLFLIAAGLVKKVAIADYLAVNLVDRVFENPAAYTSLETLLGLYGYTVQIYCDFSGYSDVAIGAALLMGFELPQNFDRPYQATNPGEFWRRWHMSLSSWLRDYLYFPLGGSRKGPLRTHINLFITLFLIGIWHGANWTFVVYGLLHASAVVAHRALRHFFPGKADASPLSGVVVLKVAAMFHFTVLSRILFRAPDIGQAERVWNQLWEGSTTTAQASWGVLALIFGTMIWHWTPRRWMDKAQQVYVALPAPVQGALLAAVGMLLMHMATGEVVPYIYLEF